MNKDVEVGKEEDVEDQWNNFKLNSNSFKTPQKGGIRKSSRFKNFDEKSPLVSSPWKLTEKDELKICQRA